ncbi:hypothetical protein V6N12_046264 [Hibiscus sabdariffa]|uniref:Uncharacterized protein n=1 Tax=Hibiscus sabdariffa TaxID=183260 RepID=A0ABR2AI61_9ROSI
MPPTFVFSTDLIFTSTSISATIFTATIISSPTGFAGTVLTTYSSTTTFSATTFTTIAISSPTGSVGTALTATDSSATDFATYCGITTDHVGTSLDLFQDFKKVSNRFVKLPNGELVKVLHEGTVRVNKDLVLSKDLKTKKLIGSARIIASLYQLQHVLAPYTDISTTACLDMSSSQINKNPVENITSNARAALGNAKDSVSNNSSSSFLDPVSSQECVDVSHQSLADVSQPQDTPPVHSIGKIMGHSLKDFPSTQKQIQQEIESEPKLVSILHGDSGWKRNNGDGGFGVTWDEVYGENRERWWSTGGGDSVVMKTGRDGGCEGEQACQRQQLSINKAGDATPLHHTLIYKEPPKPYNSKSPVLLIGDGRILEFISEIDEGLELVPADTSVVISIGTSESFPSSESRDHGTQFSKRLFELSPAEELIVIGIALQEMLPQLLFTQPSGLRLSMSCSSSSTITAFAKNRVATIASAYNTNSAEAWLATSAS